MTSLYCLLAVMMSLQLWSLSDCCLLKPGGIVVVEGNKLGLGGAERREQKNIFVVIELCEQGGGLSICPYHK